MGVVTYISPNKTSKEAELVLEDLKSKVSDADVILKELNSKIDEVNNSKNEIKTANVSASEAFSGGNLTLFSYGIITGIIILVGLLSLIIGSKMFRANDYFNQLKYIMLCVLYPIRGITN